MLRNVRNVLRHIVALGHDIPDNQVWITDDMMAMGPRSGGLCRIKTCNVVLDRGWVKLQEPGGLMLNPRRKGPVLIPVPARKVEPIFQSTDEILDELARRGLEAKEKVSHFQFEYVV